MSNKPTVTLFATLSLLLLLISGCGRTPEEEQAIAVAVALTQTAAALPTATATVAETPNPPSTPTTPITTTVSPSVTAAVSPTVQPTAIADPAAALEEIAAISLGLEPGSSEGIVGVHAQPLDTGDTGPALWAVHTYGLRSFEPEQFHLLLLYRQDERGWREVASQELRGASPAEASPDYLGEEAVRQVTVEPTSLWLQVDGGVGAHGGVYLLYRFDGDRLIREAYGSNAHPGVGQIDDLNGDGVAEVVLDVSDDYVFCYACGVRYPQYNILRWDGTRLAPVTLTPLTESAPEALRTANAQAMALVAAGLWKEAVAVIDEAIALGEEDPIFEWNAVYIQYNAAAKAAAAEDEAGYPLLNQIFYGDYPAAVAVLRDYAPDAIFALRTPLVVGTPAEGATAQLANRILSSVEPALRLRPELAEAYYLRAWATFLKNGFTDDAVLADLARAAELAPDDALFAETVALFEGTPGAATPAESDTPTDTITTTADVTSSATVTATIPAVVSPTPGGRIYFSALDVDGRDAIFMVAAAPGAQPERIVPDAIQPAVQPDGVRLAFHSTRDDMLGLGGFDQATGERLRFAYNVEDAFPTWNPAGNQLLFASTRYGDGRWRLYMVWADGVGEAVDLRYGQDPAWHPSEDLVAYKGCDEAGGHCGIWLMRSDGSERRPLTDNVGDGRPRWSPDGATLVFMSDQRDGNWEIYQVEVASGTVTRLTNSPANDGLPVISPDGASVAFVSDQTGGWAIWTMPLAGGAGQLITPIGDLPNWLEHGLDWVE
jgi:Tol biopolymer transport system component